MIRASDKINLFHFHDYRPMTIIGSRLASRSTVEGYHDYASRLPSFAFLELNQWGWEMRLAPNDLSRFDQIFVNPQVTDAFRAFLSSND